jgi:hypothetical protein
MKKTERVSLIMRFINNRAHFTIAEIQHFKRLYPPGIILSFTGMFQSSGIFNAQLDVTDVEVLEYYN